MTEPMEAKVYDLTGRDVTDCDYCVAFQMRDWAALDHLKCTCDTTKPMEDACDEAVADARAERDKLLARLAKRSRQPGGFDQDALEEEG